MTNKPKKILFSVVRNEAPFLLEWIAYNIQLGFDTIVIYSNNCDDGTHELLDELAKHGVLQHFRHDPGEKSPQWHAISHFMNEDILIEGDYVMFLDPDEFLNIKIGQRKLGDLIEYIGDYAGITVSWRLFGDSGNERFTGRLISEDYCRARKLLPGIGKTIKTLLRVVPELETINIHKPKYSSSFWEKEKTLLVGNGIPIDLNKPIYQGWKTGSPGSHIDNNDISFEIAQLNHYQFRSRAAFELKHLRGCGGDGMKNASKYSQNEAAKYNLNGAFDDTIIYYKAAVDEVIERLRGLSSQPS